MGWRSLGDSNPCFRRERATSWAARRREQAEKLSEITPISAARKESPRSLTLRWIVIAGYSAARA